MIDKRMALFAGAAVTVALLPGCAVGPTAEEVKQQRAAAAAVPPAAPPVPSSSPLPTPSEPTPSGAPTTRVGPVDPAQAPAPTPASVALEVVKRNGLTLVVAPVTVHGTEYQFLVDTGASSTLVTSDAASEMDLQSTGDSARARGVGGATTVRLAQISDWSLGGSRLPDSQLNVGSVDLPPGVSGLLGSDVLSTFGRVTIDYAGAHATFG
jgi:hypothetical protein